MPRRRSSGETPIQLTHPVGRSIWAKPTMRSPRRAIGKAPRPAWVSKPLGAPSSV
jgi:hypothetical protein